MRINDLLSFEKMNTQHELKATYAKNAPILCTTTDVDALPLQREELRESPHFDMTIVARPNNRACDDSFALNEFELGVVFDLPPGVYLTLYGTDDLLRRGYCLSQPKIITRADAGVEVRVFLEKKREVEDLNLPYRGGIVGIAHACHYALVKRTTSTARASSHGAHPNDGGRFQQNTYPSMSGGYAQATGNAARRLFE